MSARAKRAGILLAVLLTSLCGWWLVASDYGDAVVYGTYHLAQNGVECMLVMKPDHTFEQELMREGTEMHALGQWRRVGEGGISFSKDFLAVPGAEREPDGSSFADIHKAFGVLVTLEMRRYHVWYGRRDSQSGNMPLGTYQGDQSEARTTLTLRADHSFMQEVNHEGIATRSQGTWSTGPMGQISFSRTFLKTSGEQLTQDESATVEDPQDTNLQITVANIALSGPPVFRKRYWRIW
jgi:hypothetical protein